MNIYELMQKLNLGDKMPEIGYRDLILGDYASKMAEEKFPEGSIGGDQDAYRHLVWQATLQREMPFLAKFIGDLHETRIPFVGSMGQGEAEKKMDLYNNALGRKIADQATSYEDINRIAEQYVKQKRAMTVPQYIIDQQDRYLK